MSSQKHSASTILDDIINELKLNYDSSVGLLEGESVREIPGVNILLNVSKIINKLFQELSDVEKIDDEVLEAIEQHIDSINRAEDGEEEEEEHKVSSGRSKRKRHTQTADLKEETSKKRKVTSSNTSFKNEQKEQSREEDENEEESQKEEKKELEDENMDDGEEKQAEKEAIPPVQNGSFTPNNDTRLKNPKSEFVTSQTLSAEAIAELGLFSEENNGLETQGVEYLKKKYAVASYPERDLQDLLPGEIPDNDYSKTKAPSNQVQFTTYQSYIESFFRPYSNDDVKFLNEKYIIPPGFNSNNYDPNISPFIVPRLGRFYADVWSEEDSVLGAKLNSPAYVQPSLDSYKPQGSIESLNDDKLYTEDVSCGPLSSRLLSAILSTHEAKTDEDYKTQEEDAAEDEPIATQLDNEDDYKIISEQNDFFSVEERLKRELKYIGIFMNLPNADDINGKSLKRSSSIIDNDDWIKNKEDDEVCTEIRALQKDLKVASQRNRSSKKRLIPLVEEQLAYQEYCTILEDLDKQIDQAYIKRLKAKNKKKKTDPAPQQSSVNIGLRALLEKRKRWIDNIGKLFKPPEEMKRIPKEALLYKDTINEEEEQDEENDVNSPTDSILQK